MWFQKQNVFAFALQTKYICACFSFIPDLVSSGSSGSVESWEQYYCSWYVKMNLWSTARPRNLAPLPSPAVGWLLWIHSTAMSIPGAQHIQPSSSVQGHLAPRRVRRGKGQSAPASLENVEEWLEKSIFLVSWTLFVLRIHSTFYQNLIQNIG